MNILAFLQRRLTSSCGTQLSLSPELANTRRKLLKLMLAGAASVAALLELKGRAEAGPGQCSRCGCPNYVQAPYTDVCQRCYHSYSDHW